MSTPPYDYVRLGAREAQAAVAQGRVGVSEIATAGLARIALREPRLRAWAALDESVVLARAAAVSTHALLAGVLVGVKDLIDTRDFPTAYGSPIYAGHRPERDAAAVARLVAAGAVVAGKTVSTEFASFEPAVTRNPHDPEHTPGGSSSGSAAAVADGHVPVALGTQTAGSIIRPASYCGVVGYKPSYGAFPYDGVKVTAPSLDTLGLFARSVADVALVAGVLGNPSPVADRVASNVTPLRRDAAASAVPRLALCRTPWWDAASPAMQRAVLDAAATFVAAGATVAELELPATFRGLPDAHRTLMQCELATALAPEFAAQPQLIGPQLAAALRAGAATSISELQSAVRTIRRARREFAALTEDGTVLLMPAAPGAAPRGLESTGDPLYSRAWSAIGAPCLALPAGREGVLPLGLQLVAAVDADATLLRAAAWAETVLLYR